jgi:hypothetical protein
MCIAVAVVGLVIVLIFMLWMFDRAPPSAKPYTNERLCGGRPEHDFDLRFTFGQDPRWRYPGGNCVYPYDYYGFGIVDPDGVQTTMAPPVIGDAYEHAGVTIS